MKKILLVLLSILIVGCDPSVFQCGNNLALKLTITDKEAQDTYWKVSGIAVNEYMMYSTPLRWYIEAGFDTSSIPSWQVAYNDCVGFEEIHFELNLEPDDTLYWEMYHYNDDIIESDYPDFRIRRLQAQRVSSATELYD